MNCIITMAGRGSRFRTRGFDRPKYEIVVHGHTLFEWSMISLREIFTKANFIFVCLDENQSQPFVEKYCARLGITQFKTAVLNEVTDGQATSALAAKGCITNERQPVLIYNIDTHIHPHALAPVLATGEAAIPCFHAPGEHWSFVRTDARGFALETAEKKRISDCASVGLYSFSSFLRFETAYYATFAVGAKTASERYIAPMYNVLLRWGDQVRVPLITPESIVPLGTPEEVARFTSSAHARWPAREKGAA